MGQQSTSQDIQNRFTAYLQTALKRKKRDYAQKQMHITAHEFLTDFQDTQYSGEYTIISETLFSFSVEDQAFMRALSMLKARDRYIFFERVLNGTSYHALANRLNLQYSSVAAAYRRTIQKLKVALEEESK